MKLSQLALRYLKQQKKRSWLTAIGIMLSMALIFSSTSMGEALKDYMFESIKLDRGNYHAAYLGLSQEQIDQLKDHAKIAETAVKLEAGYYNVRTGISIRLTGGEQEFLNVMSLKLEEGALPVRNGEVALERWVVENMPVRPKVGDKLQWKITDSKPGAGNQQDSAPAEQQSQDVEVVLTGIFKNKANTQLYGMSQGIISLDYADRLRQVFHAPQNEWDAAVLFKDGIKLQAAIQDTAAALGVTDQQVAPNHGLLTALGEGGDNSQNRAVVIAQAIVIGIIMVATVAVIYNAFHISVLERIRQFGLLRSIGMTPRQIRGLVLREAAILGGTGIPAGILLGWGVIAALLALFRLMDKGQFLGSFEVHIHWYVPLATLLVGVITVLLSAYGPAFSAGRVTPLDAILHQNRFNKDKAMRAKRRWFSAVPMTITMRMARDNLKRNRKRYRITLFSMSIGIVLYVFFSSFMSTIQEAGAGEFYKDFALHSYGQGAGYTEADYKDAAAIPGVKRVYRLMEQYNNSVQFPVEKVTESYLKDRAGLKELNQPIRFGAVVYGYQPAELELFKPMLQQGSVDSDRMDAENGVMVIQKLNTPNGAVIPTDLEVGDRISYGEMNGETNEYQERTQLKVLGILEGSPFNEPGSQYSIITSEKMFSKLTGKTHFQRFDIELEPGSDTAAVKAELRTIADRSPDGRLSDYSEDDQRVVMLQISILLYGLVAVISVISAINIINTISTNLILRTREFGTLRAVGMTMKQMRRMIVFESIWYGIMATVFGGFVGSVLSYWFYKNIDHVKDIPFDPPVPALLAAGIASALLCLLASRVPMKRIERMDIVHAIRAEE